LNLDRLRQGINLRAYGQRDPLNEYKQEAFTLFEMMSSTIREETVKILSLFDIPSFGAEEILSDTLLQKSENAFDDDSEEGMVDPQKQAVDLFATPRNAQCPCGSGLKDKYCCGKVEE
jgi:preprotein translocase subunit SecA